MTYMRMSENVFCIQADLSYHLGKFHSGQCRRKPSIAAQHINTSLNKTHGLRTNINSNRNYEPGVSHVVAFQNKPTIRRNTSRLYALSALMFRSFAHSVVSLLNPWFRHLLAHSFVQVLSPASIQSKHH